MIIILTKTKEFVKKHEHEIILFSVVVLISLLSFALGYICARIGEKPALIFE